MPLTAISEPPQYISPDSEELSERTTPATFVGLPPQLRTRLEQVTAVLDPGLPDASHGSALPPWQAQGTLYVTNDTVSFLDVGASKGFTVDFPSISLHAISRTIPEALKALAQASNSSACLYCQLDDSAGEEDDKASFPAQDEDQDEAMDETDGGEHAGEGQDEDASQGVRELWLLTKEPEELQPLFDMLSYCASLHPSGGTEDDPSGGNPFVGMAGLGSGAGGPVLDLSELSAQGAFDDAIEDTSTSVPNGTASTQVNGDGLSEAGRAVLARLEGTIDWPSDVRDTTGSSTYPATRSPPTRDVKTKISNTLILTSLPESLFNQPELLSDLLDLLHAYGPLQSWTPLPSMGRALVVFDDGIGPPDASTGGLSRGQESAQRAKEALDRLRWEVEEDGQGGGSGDADDEEVMEWPPKKVEGKEARDGSAMRAYYGPPSSVLLATDADEALAVPSLDKNFLISPPGSPPVGWEPIKEDPPNRDTLAWDLIKALGELRDQGGTVESWQAAPLDESVPGGDANEVGGKGGVEKKLGAPSLVIPPSEAKVTRRQAATPGSIQPRPVPFMDRVAARAEQADAVQAHDEAGSTTKSSDDDAVVISVPGVVVQAFEDDVDDEEAARRARRQPRTGMSISSVKATVESMFSSSSAPTITAPRSEASSSDAHAVGDQLSALRLQDGPTLGAGFDDASGGGRRITPTGRPPLA